MNIKEANQLRAELLQYKENCAGSIIVSDIIVAPLDYAERIEFVRAYLLGNECSLNSLDFEVVVILSLAGNAIFVTADKFKEMLQDEKIKV